MLTIPAWLERTLDILFFALVLGVTSLGVVLVAGVSINAVWGPDAGLGLLVVLFSALPLSLLIGLLVGYRYLKHLPLTYRHLLFLLVSLGSAAALGPLVIAVIHGP